MLQLHNLTRLHKSRKRVGRGGDQGGTSGKGHKGQKARSGPRIKAFFEGGQMPLSRRLPKRGFCNTRFATQTAVISIADLERVYQAGQTVDHVSLYEAGLISRKEALHNVKVLGNGQLSKALIVSVNAYSKSAREAIEKAGGTVSRPKETLHGSDAS